MFWETQREVSSSFLEPPSQEDGHITSLSVSHSIGAIFHRPRLVTRWVSDNLKLSRGHLPRVVVDYEFPFAEMNALSECVRVFAITVLFPLANPNILSVNGPQGHLK